MRRTAVILMLLLAAASLLATAGADARTTCATVRVYSWGRQVLEAGPYCAWCPAGVCGTLTNPPFLRDDAVPAGVQVGRPSPEPCPEPSAEPSAEPSPEASPSADDSEQPAPEETPAC